MSFPVLDLPGNPKEAGLVHGRVLSREIHENLKLYRERWEEELGLSWEEGLRRARVHLARLEVYSPQHCLSVLGVAEGASITLEEAAFLDGRYELFYAEFAKRDFRGECSSLAILPERSCEGRLLLAQNWDWFPGVRGAWLRFSSYGISILAFTEAGIPGGKIGINSRGLALCVSGLVSPFDRWDGEGLPFHARASAILSSATFEEALEWANFQPSPCSVHFLLGQGDKVLGVEISPNGNFILQPRDGVLVHTNHFLAADFPVPFGTDWRFSSARQKRLEELFAQYRQLDLPAIWAILSDHFGFPESICRHFSHQKIEPQYVTVLSCILDPQAGRIHYKPGPPCETSLRYARQLG
ncbi:peptidase C45 [Candidatus Bipolaricaulota bacterium]|nr:peptidase C45 [Candidatus Bipolaricaulota bacterium]